MTWKVPVHKIRRKTNGFSLESSLNVSIIVNNFQVWWHRKGINWLVNRTNEVVIPPEILFYDSYVSITCARRHRPVPINWWIKELRATSQKSVWESHEKSSDFLNGKIVFSSVLTRLIELSEREKSTCLAKISNLWQTDERDDKHYPTHAFYVTASNRACQKNEEKQTTTRHSKDDCWLYSTLFLFSWNFVGTNTWKYNKKVIKFLKVLRKMRQRCQKMWSNHTRYYEATVCNTLLIYPYII